MEVLGVAALLLVFRPASAPAQESPALSCYEQVRDGLRLGEPGALELCQGALSEAPAQCFIEADRRLFLTDHDMLLLCRCATSTAPVDCFLQAERETFLADYQILQLCSPVLNGYPAGCAFFYFPTYTYPPAPFAPVPR